MATSISPVALRRAAAAILAGLALAGCGTSKSEPPATQAREQANVLISADWGATKVAEGRAPAGSVLDATHAVAPVETTYGGRYVSSLAGEAGDGEREWVFWVNGIEADVGAADVEVGANDRVWWDLHRWTGRTNVPAVVGQWPAPLTRALTRDVGAVTADAAFLPAIEAAGGTATAPAAADGPRAIAGASDDLAQRDPAWAAALADPERYGLTAWFEKGQIVVWDAASGTAVPVPAARAIMVAFTADGTSQGDPIVVVAGRTAKDADAALARLVDDPFLPQRHAAICLDGSGLIVCSGGQGKVP